MKLLVLQGMAPPGEPPATPERYRALRERALGVASQSVVVTAGAAAAPDSSAGPHRIVRLDPDRFAGGLAIDGVILDFAPDAVVALGLFAALAIGRLTATTPCWVDLAEDPIASPRPPRPWGRDADFDYRHELLWMLDRADRISCADERVASSLRAMLGLRGRLADGAAGDDLLVLRDPADGAALDLWLRRPAARRTPPRILGKPEISDYVRLGGAESELASLRGRALPRLGGRLRAGLARLRRLSRRAARVAESAIAAPWILLDAARLGRSRSPEAKAAGPETAPGSGVELGRRPRLLVVMPYRIFPPRHGGAVRLAGLLERLSRRCDLHVLRFDQRGENRLERAALERFCRRVDFHHWVVPPVDAEPDPVEPAVATLFADERAAWRIRQIVESESIDVVQLEYVEMAQYRRAARPAQVVLVEHDVAYRSQERRRELALASRFSRDSHHRTSWLELRRLRRYELAAAREVDELHFMSLEDATEISRRLPTGTSRSRVVPNTVDTRALAPPPGAERRGEVLFVGNFANLPNRDALEWLLAEIWPLVRALRPEARLTVAGAEMPPAIRERGGRDGIEVLGEVGSMADLYHSHRALLVPLRAGSGTRLKILEAFAAGIAVVSTRLGREGIEARDGEHLVEADEAQELARGVVGLLADPARAAALAAAGRALVVESYDADRAAERNFESVLALALRGRPAAVTGSGPVVDRLVEPELDVSIVIPTRRGGPLLAAVLESIARQRTSRSFEVTCIDSGSTADELATMRRSGARVVEIAPESFDHGRTRDLGAAESRGRALVFLNQDAVPASDEWLETLTAPLFAPVPPAAVQGGILEFGPDDARAPRRLYWDSGGPRFNFTRESRAWIARHGGIGFSTVNCAIRRDVWREIPFGRARIMEDKLWQARATEREHRIVAVDAAAVLHTHHYELGGLLARSIAEGEGWRRAGERYRFRDALADSFSSPVWRDWRRGVRERRLRNAAEWLFPFARPYGLWRGNVRAGREIR